MYCGFGIGVSNDQLSFGLPGTQNMLRQVIMNARAGDFAAAMPQLVSNSQHDPTENVTLETSVSQQNLDLSNCWPVVSNKNWENKSLTFCLVPLGERKPLSSFPLDCQTAVAHTLHYPGYMCIVLRIKQNFLEIHYFVS